LRLRHAGDDAQGWQRNACYRIVDATERDRCLGGTNLTCDEYRRRSRKHDDDGRDRRRWRRCCGTSMRRSRFRSPPMTLARAGTRFQWAATS